MKKRIAFVLIVSMLFSIVFGANTAIVNAADKHKTTDQYSVDTLLARYSTAEIVSMYPELSAFLAEKLRNCETDISVRDYNISKDDIGAVYFSVVCENPDIFYVFSTRFETTAVYETGQVISIRPEYYFDGEEIPAKIEEFNNKTEQILSGVDRSWSDVIKARYIHDMLAHYAEYDTKYETISDENYPLFRVQMRIYSAYGAIVDNNAVCEGFALAYKYLLSKVGVRCYYIQSVKNRHAWNIVQTEGKFYHVDITHDDLTYDNLGRVNHNNFFKSDNWFANDGDSEHTDWITNLKADDTSFDNAWWNSVTTVIYRNNSYDYYINQTYTSSIYAAVSRRNIYTGEVEVLSVLKTRWWNFDVANAYYGRAFSYITSDGTYFYYNDNENVYRMSVNGGTAVKVYSKSSGLEGCIYGVAFKLDGQLYATIKKSPNEKDIIIKLNIQVQPPTEPTETQQGSTATTEPQESTSPVTEPPSENFTQPTEPITAAPTEPETVEPAVVKKSLKTYIKRKITLTLKPAGSYKFSSSNKSVAAVSSKGVITAKKKGKAIITAKSSSVIFKITLTVKNPKLNYTKKTIRKNKSFKLKVTGGSGKIVYTTSNKKIATIKGKGKIIGKKKGKTTITVKVCGLRLKCKVTVK